MTSISFAAFLLITFLLNSSIAAESPTKFMFAYGAIGGNAMPLWIAKEQGIFRKYNLDPQLIYIIAGRAMQSMLAGDIQFGLLGATHVTNAVTAGGDMAMLLGMEDKLNYFLNVRPGIKSADDLKGKKVGIGTPSGSLALATYVGLDHLGLVPRRDRITLLNTGSTPERMSALFAGSIDAAFFNPEVEQIVLQQGFPILLDLGKENVPFQASGLVASRKYMRGNPLIVENLAKAVIEGVAFVQNPANKKIVVDSIARNLRLDRPDRLERAYRSIAETIPRKPCPTLPGIASVLKLMTQHGLNPKAAELKAEDIADVSLCKKLDDSGFFARLR
jgi:ABC-type nitrate/sulfonate/bicarbonate transport system substrate-binding protein